MRRCLTFSFLLALPGCLGTAGGARPSYVADPRPVPVGELVVFQNNTAKVSYQTAQGADVQGVSPVQRVQGRACQHGLAVPVLSLFSASGAPSLGAAWGQGAYRDAVQDARRGLPAEAVLYDVRADLNLRMILSVYRELCLEVDAAVAIPAPAVPADPAP